MKESVYKVVELIGSSPASWEKAAKTAVLQASKTLKNLRIAEVAGMDMHLTDKHRQVGCVLCFRARRLTGNSRSLLAGGNRWLLTRAAVGISTI